MAKIKARILYVYPTQQLISKSGNAYQKRDFVINPLSFDGETGEPTFDEDNIPQLSITGDRCSQLDGLKKGDCVTVEFYLRGHRYRNPESNKESIITDINVRSVKPDSNMRFPIPQQKPDKQPIPVLPTASNGVTDNEQKTDETAIAGMVPVSSNNDDLPF